MNASLLFAATALAAAPFDLTAKPTEVEVANLSNQPVWVAEARTTFARPLETGGWTRIEPNRNAKFKCTAEQRLYLRIVRDSREVTFKGYDAVFKKGPTHSERFTSTVPRSDQDIRVLRHGSKLESSANVRKDGALPAGWSVQRFFEVPTGANHRLRLSP